MAAGSPPNQFPGNQSPNQAANQGSSGVPGQPSMVPPGTPGTTAPPGGPYYASQFPPPPPPPKSSNALAWILGIIGGGILLLIIGAIAIVLLVVRSVHVNQSGDKVEIETPVGALRANKGNGHTGLMVYPGATPVKAEGANVQVSSNWGGAGVAIEKYHTGDTRDQVQEWYAKHLGNGYKLQTADSNGHNKIDGLNTQVSEDEVAFVDDSGKGAKVISLKQVSGGTDITLIRAGKREED